MPECPICSKEFNSRGPSSLKTHVMNKHYDYWARGKRLRILATASLSISLMLTILLVAAFYSADFLGYGLLGVAGLFLAFSSAFSLKERRLPKKYRAQAVKNRSGVTHDSGKPT